MIKQVTHCRLTEVYATLGKKIKINTCVVYVNVAITMDT